MSIARNVECLLLVHHVVGAGPLDSPLDKCKPWLSIHLQQQHRHVTCSTCTCPNAAAMFRPSAMFRPRYNVMWVQMHREPTPITPMGPCSNAVKARVRGLVCKSVHAYRKKRKVYAGRRGGWEALDRPTASQPLTGVVFGLCMYTHHCRRQGSMACALTNLHEQVRSVPVASSAVHCMYMHSS